MASLWICFLLFHVAYASKSECSSTAQEEALDEECMAAKFLDELRNKHSKENVMFQVVVVLN